MSRQGMGLPFSLSKQGGLTKQILFKKARPSDVDHIGALQEILKAAEHEVQVIAHNVEKPFIEGNKRPLKMTKERLTAMFAHLPED